MAALTMSEPPTSAKSRAAYLRKSPPRCCGRCGAPGAGPPSGGVEVGRALLACRTHPRSTSVTFRRAARDSGPPEDAVVCELVCGNVIRLPRGRSRPSADPSLRDRPSDLAALAASQQQEGYQGPCIEYHHGLQGGLEAAAFDFPNIRKLQRFGSQLLLDRQIFEALRVLAGRELVGICDVEEAPRLPATGELGGRQGHGPDHVPKEQNGHHQQHEQDRDKRAQGCPRACRCEDRP